MSLKYSNTTADFLQWNEAMNLIRKLFKDGNYNMSLLIALGCFSGLRISDILSLRWNQILNVNEFTIIERKTGKKRTIRINPQLQRHISDCYKSINPTGSNAPVLISQKGTVYSVQRINIILKELKKKYRLHIGNFSCHSLRHTFTTRMCEAGVNVKVIQDALGHKDVSTTLNIYTDVTKELRKSEFEGLELQFNQ